jgi:hypothetical protein
MCHPAIARFRAPVVSQLYIEIADETHNDMGNSRL